MLFSNPYSKVKVLIAAGKIAQSITILHQYKRDQDDENEIILLESRLNTLERDRRLSQISRADFDNNKAEIRFALLALSKSMFESRPNYIRISIIIILSLTMGYIIYLYFSQNNTLTTYLPTHAKPDSVVNQPQIKPLITDTKEQYSNETPSTDPKTEKNKTQGKSRNEEAPKEMTEIPEMVTLRGRALDKGHLGVAGVLINTIHGQHAISDSMGFFTIKINPKEFPSSSLNLIFKKGGLQGEVMVSTLYGINDIEINLSQ